jgi:hypothetical protein
MDTMSSRVSTASAFWRRGRACGIPWCCVARFCVEALVGRPPGQYLRRGRHERYGPIDGWVPCLIFHHQNERGSLKGP